MAKRQLEQVLEYACAKFPCDAVCGQHTEQLGQHFEAQLEQTDGGKDCHHDQQGRLTLEWQDAVDDDLEYERLHQRDQAQADGEEDQLDIERRELPKRLSEPGKRNFAGVISVSAHRPTPLTGYGAEGIRLAEFTPGTEGP